MNAPESTPSRLGIGGRHWQRLPDWRDPRVPFFLLLLAYLFVGITWLGFNRSFTQVSLTILAACILDVILARLLRGQYVFPLSAAITGASLGILLNYAHDPWLPLVPVFFAIGSKYLLTFQGRHVYNPSLFGVVAALSLSDGMFSAAPSYQWGGTLSVSLLIVTAALLVFVFRIRRGWLIVSFLVFYILALGLRAWMTRWHLPPETLILGTLSAPAFYLFTFFMITDPATSPHTRRGQVLMALTIVLVDLALHRYQSYSTLFYAGFAYFTVRFIYLHLRHIYHSWWPRWRAAARSLLVLVPLGMAGAFIYKGIIQPIEGIEPGFTLHEVAAREAGIVSRPGDLLERVDPRIAHVAKWLMSIGDAVAVADVDNDGLQDVFLTYPLKQAADRVALYLNRGNFQFQRFPMTALSRYAADPERFGLPSAALWFDADNDGDQDLLVLFSFGPPRLFQNRLQETGTLDFVERDDADLREAYLVSLGVNALDMDNDGRLDLLVGNAMNPWLPGYERPTRFNIFRLPDAAYPGDRRMFNFMHRSWHDAANGGENLVFLNSADGFRRRPAAAVGMPGTRWTLDIGTADLDGDGLMDVYLANDFGPDALYRNTGQGRFTEIRGPRIGTLGRDTYKGMNATLADFDNNGHADIYVSNVHEPLQAEGSLLWMNSGRLAEEGAAAFRDAALRRNALNEQRFGWGAATGDLDGNGYLDIVQANGMVDDAYDRRFDDCPDYWYWNARIALAGPDIHGYADAWADLRGYCIFPAEMNRLYLNRGTHFVDVAEQVHFGRPGNSRGVALVDLDNDGDLDILVTHQFAPVSIFRNESVTDRPRQWLGLLLEGNGQQCNRDAIGSRVVLTTTAANGEHMTQSRQITASNGFSAQGDRRVLFGLPVSQAEIEVDIHWCGAATPQRLRLGTGRYHQIRQASP